MCRISTQSTYTEVPMVRIFHVEGPQNNYFVEKENETQEILNNWIKNW